MRREQELAVSPDIPGHVLRYRVDDWATPADRRRVEAGEDLLRVSVGIYRRWLNASNKWFDDNGFSMTEAFKLRSCV